MTSSTLMMGTTIGLAVVSLLSTLVLGAVLLWAGRRLLDTQKAYSEVTAVKGKLSNVATELRNLDELFESYRKRDAQRVSSAKQRSQKASQKDDQEEEQAELTFETAEDVLKRFQATNREN